MRRFTDRAAAGRTLAARLTGRGLRRPVVLALPRGGVPVAAEIARALGAPLDLVPVARIAVPEQPALALGAVVDGAPPTAVINDTIRRLAVIDDTGLEALRTRALAELRACRARYRPAGTRVPLRGATAIVVDDGIATGATSRAALIALRRAGPARLVLAVPVAPGDTIQMLRQRADDVVCLETPVPFHAIGDCYRDFAPVDDGEVATLLARHAEMRGTA